MIHARACLWNDTADIQILLAFCSLNLRKYFFGLQVTKTTDLVILKDRTEFPLQVLWGGGGGGGRNRAKYLELG